MVGAVVRAYRMWRAKANLLAPCTVLPTGMFWDRALLFQELKEVIAAGGPPIPPYQGISQIWHTHSSAGLPDYTSFLVALAKLRRIELRAVLDLACGTGALTTRLVAAVPVVVGLDASEPMLAVAQRTCQHLPNVELIHGDFRDFTLDRSFDAVVCASNSLNYVANGSELSQVFRSVAKHLRPGGLMVFDTITEFGMKALDGVYFHAVADGLRFAIYSAYDPKQRKETSWAIVPTGVEVHRRIPLDPEDILKAAKGTGLEVDDYFSSALIPDHWLRAVASFFVLTKRGD